jgi:hypothetical protein
VDHLAYRLYVFRVDAGLAVSAGVDWKLDDMARGECDDSGLVVEKSVFGE